MKGKKERGRELREKEDDTKVREPHLHLTVFLTDEELCVIHTKPKGSYRYQAIG